MLNQRTEAIFGQSRNTDSIRTGHGFRCEHGIEDCFLRCLNSGFEERIHLPVIQLLNRHRVGA